MKIIFVTLLLTISLGCQETFESNYNSIDEAQELIDRGWLPEWIPKSAYDIKEAHNIDTNAMIVSFKLDSVKELNMVNQCRSIEPHLLEKPTIHKNWWSSDLLDKSSANEYIFFQCNEGYLAIPENTQKMYYWEP